MSTFAPQSQAYGGSAVYPAPTAGVLDGFSPARSSAPYLGKEPDPAAPPKPHTKCMFKRPDGKLCQGPRAKETEYCIGHLRSLAKQEAQHESE